MPTSVEDLVAIVTLAHRSSKQLRAAGAGHSPSDLACVDSKPDRGVSNDRRSTDEEEAIDRRFEEDGGWMVRMDLMTHVYEVSGLQEVFLDI
jgi:FAD/FMN-containing dehydrogenase